ncbi:hypothetical protein RQP46_000124 [Phenoliferia psychrophenolica]
MRVPTLSGPTHPPAPIRSLAASIDVLVNFLREGAKGRGTMILTGAGVSVDSGIRAYRGKDGSYTVNKERQPIFYGQFVEHEAYRRRYWAQLGEGVKYEEFNVPPCDSCGGSMKPKVVFFGESLSPEVREDSKRLVREASQVLVIGSELATFSAYSLVKQKREEGGQLGLVNVGRCRGDPDFNWRIGWEGGAGDILPAAAKILAQDEGRAGIKEEVDLMLRSGKVKKISGTRATT